MKTEEKNIAQMLELIAKNKALLEYQPVDLKKYEHLNLCEDYKTILEQVGKQIDFSELGVEDTYTEEENIVGYLFQQVISIHTPGDSFEDEFEYTNKLFYEIGRAYNGDSLVQIHTGTHRGMVMLTDHETFPTQDELEDEIGDLEKLTPDELFKFLNQDFDCIMSFEKIDVVNVADFLIKKLSNIPYSEKRDSVAVETVEKPDSVPADAVWVPKYKQWHLGKKDENGDPIGAWKNYLAPNGHLVCEIFYGDNKDTFSFTRYHEDGTVSQKGNIVDNVNTGMAMWQGSKNPTTENWVNPPIFRCEAEYDNGDIVWVKYWNIDGVEIDPYGNVIKP
jgi:hypothetical protein